MKQSLFISIVICFFFTTTLFATESNETIFLDAQSTKIYIKKEIPEQVSTKASQPTQKIFKQYQNHPVGVATGIIANNSVELDNALMLKPQITFVKVAVLQKEKIIQQNNQEINLAKNTLSDISK